LETEEYERRRYARLFALLEHCRYSKVLEIGCGAGVFTRLLARIADRVVGIDVAQAAIDRARSYNADSPNVVFETGNIMEYDFGSEGPWDLIVLSETIYYLGWLYPFFDVAWLAHELQAATTEGGSVLLANSSGETNDYLIRPWVIRTYHDLFLNVGFEIEREEVFRGTKHGVDYEVLMALLSNRTDGERQRRLENRESMANGVLPDESEKGMTR
jgi:SAM-dependent methyltransferase